MRDNTTDLSEVVKGLGLKEKHHAERALQRPVKAAQNKEKAVQSKALGAIRKLRIHHG